MLAHNRGQKYVPKGMKAMSVTFAIDIPCWSRRSIVKNYLFENTQFRFRPQQPCEILVRPLQRTIGHSVYNDNRRTLGCFCGTVLNP